MAGCTKWLTCSCLTALAASGLMITLAAPLGAQEPTAAQADAPDRAEARAQWHRLELKWEALREDLRRTALETTLTMFLIRASPKPPTPHPPPPPPPPPVATPPAQGPNTPPDSNPPPDPPTGQGDPPTQIDPPPASAPEPAGVVIGLVGAGLAAAYRWRKRRGEIRKA
jgi:hypothetical protein